MRRARWLVLLTALLVGCNRGSNPPRPEVAAPQAPVEPETFPPEPPVKGASLPRLGAIPPDAAFKFAVVGDNRGESSGKAAPAFLEIVSALRANPPDLILNTGDIVNGYKGEDEAQLRKLWGGYNEAVAELKAPLFHVPGNHDVFDPISARLWKELWGPTYYAFDHGCARFIALDTETERSRVGRVQLEWLRRQLEENRQHHVFVFLHKPLFPIDGHIGSSLDEFPEDRDRLHSLFLEHRRSIKGVFQGHEHLYHFDERDGVPYHIVAGGGAPLYVPPELGGFYHYLLVGVTPKRVSVEVKKVLERIEPARPAVPVEPGTLLEGWESGRFWYSWDQGVRRQLTRSHASAGKQGLKIAFDTFRYQWPLLFTILHPRGDLSQIEELAIDVFVPEESVGIQVTPVIKGEKSNEAPAVVLKPGWNTVSCNLNGGWLPKVERQSARELQWTLEVPDKKLASWVVFDNLRSRSPGRDSTEGPKTAPEALLPPGLLESWEDRVLWGAYNETVTPEKTASLATEGKHGLKLSYNLASFNRPVLYAAADPPWDLSRVGRLTMEVFAPDSAAVRLNPVLTGNGTRHRAPAVALKPGWNRVVFDLDGPWLPPDARASVGQLEWVLSAAHRRTGWVVFDNLRAESP